MMDTQLMTNEQFDALCDFLDSEEGCNFYYRIPGDTQSVTWTCDNTLAMTRQWMQKNNIGNIEANIEHIELLGGHCDCEVLFNAADRWENGK